VGKVVVDAPVREVLLDPGLARRLGVRPAAAAEVSQVLALRGGPVTERDVAGALMGR
jgi:hypothetical protein